MCMNYRGCHREKAAADVAIPVFFSSTDIGIATVASLLPMTGWRIQRDYLPKDREDRNQTVKLSPQPHSFLAFGLLNLNPSFNPSLP